MNIPDDLRAHWLATLELPRLRWPGELDPLLKLLPRSSPDRPVRVAELGSYAGESAVQFLRAGVTKLYCVDRWQAGYDKGDRASNSDMAAAELAFDVRTAGHEGRVVKIKATTLDAVQHVPDNYLDMVYVDAAHDYDSVRADLLAWLPKVKAGGYVAGHDYNERGHPDVRRAVDDVIGPPDRTFPDKSWASKVPTRRVLYVFDAAEPILHHPCGCVSVRDRASGVMRARTKCRVHRVRDGGDLGLDYYREIGNLDARGVPRHHAYVREFLDAFSATGVSASSALGGRVLDVGCGLGVYAPLCLACGCAYEGLERSAAAAAWVRGAFGVTAHVGSFEAFDVGDVRYDHVLAVHVLEHLDDSPAMLAKLHGLLKPGGRVWVVVPDDTDLLNPDHLWFYSEATLRSAMERVGFTDVRTHVRRVIERENFIYATAVKE